MREGLPYITYGSPSLVCLTPGPGMPYARLRADVTRYTSYTPSTPLTAFRT